MKARTGPLSDLRILDFTQALAGPFCTMLLADLGAEVIKVEPPQGDMCRKLGPRPQDEEGCDYGGYFASINRNKRSIVLDLKVDSDVDTALKLVETVDGVVENSRAGVMDRLGLSYETLIERNPKLVYAAVRGFGDPRTGESPYVQWPAFDIVAQSVGGIVGTSGPVGCGGMKVGPGVGDIFPGTLAALGVVSAIHNAQRTGKGQFVDVAMYDGVLALCENIIYHYSYDDRVLGPPGNGHQVLCPFDIFDTKDGAIAIAAPRDTQWETLCHVIGRTELIDKPGYETSVERGKRREELTGIIGAWTRERSTAEIVDRLGGQVPVGPVNNARDIFNDPHATAREMLVDIQLPGANPSVVIAGCPIKLTETPSGIYRRPPLLGEHKDEILAEAGIAQI